MKGKVLFIVTLLFVLLAGRAEAQRCLPKMRGIELRAGLNEADGYVLGAMLSSYAKGGNKWVYGLEYLKTSHGYRSTTIPAAQFTAEGGYYYNFLSDAKKVVFFYAGASALAGYETVNWGRDVMPKIVRHFALCGVGVWLRRHAGNGAVPRGLHCADGLAA